MSPKLQESGEDYLETIFLLREKNGAVRSIDVADALGFSRPSVSRAVGILRDAGLLSLDENGRLLLTAKGEAKALAVYDRHRLITAFLHEGLGVEEDTAERDACRIEHVISDETFEKIKHFIACRKEEPRV